jgi:hypothetical protein
MDEIDALLNAFWNAAIEGDFEAAIPADVCTVGR